MKKCFVFKKNFYKKFEISHFWYITFVTMIKDHTRHIKVRLKERNMKEHENNELSNALKKLKLSPIFAMSLGSKELFHSNFWAWIFDNYPQFIKTFFPDIDTKDINDVKREQEHRDITIWTNGNTKAYVIENKLKSMPRKEQLNEYENKLGVRFEGGVLTGIEKQNFELPEKWQFVSYERIYDGVFEIVESLDDGLHKAILSEYADVLQSMVKVISAYNRSCANSFPAWGITGMESELLNLKLWDVCQKLKVNQFLKYANKIIDDKLSEQIKTIRETTNYELKFHTNYTNGSALSDWRLVQIEKNTDSSCVSLGIQIQNGQYRKFVQKEGTGLVQEKLYEDYKGIWFDDKAKIGNTKMRHDFCCYKGSQQPPYIFVYQYTMIENYAFDNLCSQIIDDLGKIIELIKDMKI